MILTWHSPGRCGRRDHEAKVGRQRAGILIWSAKQSKCTSSEQEVALVPQQHASGM